MARFRFQRNRRRGMALPLVLFCIAMAMVMGAALIQSILLEHHQVETIEHQYQALWLAESAADRAAYLLRQDASYSGETWNIPAAALGNGQTAAVTIQVITPENASDRREILVQAVYPDDPRHRVTEEITRVVKLSPTETDDQEADDK